MRSKRLEAAQRVVLRALLASADPHQLTKKELLLLVDLLSSALSLADPPPDFRKQLVGR